MIYFINKLCYNSFWRDIMSDKELKKIIEETVGNNDPYWNEPAFNVVKKIIDLPENAETSIYKLCDNDNKSNSKFMFKI